MSNQDHADDGKTRNSPPSAVTTSSPQPGGLERQASSHHMSALRTQTSSATFGPGGGAAALDTTAVPTHIRVLFLGKREFVVPTMIAIAGNTACRSVPDAWDDSKVIEIDLPTTFNNVPQSKQQQQQQPVKEQEFIATTFYFSEHGHAVHEVQPHVVVICYNPIDGLKSVKGPLDEYSFEVRAATPRPAICLCGVNAEKLHTVTDIDSNPVTESEACDLFVRTRAAGYCEVSSSLGVHLAQAAECIAHAALLHAEKRPTPEIIKAMRDHVVAAAFAGAKWVARRDRKTRKIFYFNRDRKKAQWERPHDFDGIEPMLSEEEKRQQAAAELEAGERRARLDRERQVNDAYLADVQVYEDRMKSLNKRHEEAGETALRYEKEVVDLRRQMGENSELLRKLQQRHDSRAKNRSSFVNSAAERDSLVEKEFQAARERMLEIEAKLKLADEKDEDVHLTELALENRKLATDVRACLQKQLETQKTLASDSARCSELARESGELNITLMKLKKKQQESRRALAEGNDELGKLRAILNNLDAQIDQVVNADMYEIGAQSQRQKQLYRAITHAEKALKDARGSIKSRQVVEEHERLKHEQKKLVSDVGEAAAAAARWELKVRRALSSFEVIGRDLEDVLSDVHSAATDVAGYIQAAASSMQLKLDRSYYSSAARLQQQQQQLATAGGSGAVINGNKNNSNTPLEDKLISLHRAALHVVRESHKDTIKRSQKVNDVGSAVADVFDDALSIPEQTGAAPISETWSASQRLVAKCGVAIKTAQMSLLLQQQQQAAATNTNSSVVSPNKKLQNSSGGAVASPSPKYGGSGGGEELQNAIIASFENHLRKSVSNEQQEQQKKKNVRTLPFRRF